MPNKPACKVIIVGNSTVGKTTIVDCYARGGADPNVRATFGCNFSECAVCCGDDDDNPTRMILWDTAGQERFRSCTRGYFRDAEACIIVFSITDRKSFEDVPEWIEMCKQFSGNIPIILVGNKIDIYANRTVLSIEGEQLAAKFKLNAFYETSAFSGKNIAGIFHHTALLVSKEYCENTPQQSLAQIDISNSEKPASTDSCCSGMFSSCADQEERKNYYYRFHHS